MKLSIKEQDFEIKYSQTKEGRIKQAILKITELNTYISVTMYLSLKLFTDQGKQTALHQITDYLALG